jgi:hypothetical protein
MKPKYGLKKRVRFLHGGETLEGRIVEITLFRRETERMLPGNIAFAYGVQSLDRTEYLYIGEEQICE